MSEVKSYSVESIALALAHHESRGAISDVEHPDDIKRKWRVRFGAGVHVGGLGIVSLTTPQAYALCLGLRAGEVIEQRSIAALTQQTPPPCVDDEPAVIELSDGTLVDVSDRPTRCGIHGDDTTSGRCYSCDDERLTELLARLDAASTITEAEGPYAAVVELAMRQPRLLPRVRSWANTAPADDDVTS